MNPEQDQQPTPPATPDPPATPEFVPPNTQPFPAIPIDPNTPQNTAVADDPGKTLAIVSLVLALIVPLIGLILAIIANAKSKKVGIKNTLAVVAIVLNSVLLVLGALISGLLIWAILSTISRPSSGSDVSNNKPTQAQDEFTANVIANKPIKDLFWDDLYSPGSADWTMLHKNVGSSQFLSSSSRCTVWFDQPSGLKPRGVTSSEQVATDFAASMSTSTTAYHAAKDGYITIKFSQPQKLSVLFETFKIKNAEGSTVGLVSSTVQGNFGLIVSGFCPPTSLAEVQTSVRKYMQSKTATLIYE